MVGLPCLDEGLRLHPQDCGAESYARLDANTYHRSSTDMLTSPLFTVTRPRHARLVRSAKIWYVHFIPSYPVHVRPAGCRPRSAEHEARGYAQPILEFAEHTYHGRITDSLS